MWTLVALSLLAADDAPPAASGLAVFTAPVAPAVGAAWGLALKGPPIVFIPVGLAFTAGDVEWIADAAFMHKDALPTATPGVTVGGYSGTWLSLGAVFHSGARALNGFFLSPKLTLGVFRARDDVFGTVQVGLDTGYQVTFGPVYLAFVFGVSIGIGVNDTDGMAGPLFIDSVGAARKSGVATGANLQLFRIGYVF